MTSAASAFIRQFLEAQGARIILDIECGDWTEFPALDWAEIGYVGINSDAQVVDTNRWKRARHHNCYFLYGDARTAALPNADVALFFGLPTKWEPQDLPPLLARLHPLTKVLFIVDSSELHLLRACGLATRTIFSEREVQVELWTAEGAVSGPSTVDWDRVELTEDNAADFMTLATAHLPAQPGSWTEERGIVIPAGGPRYLPCAWIAVRMLREIGCALPIELWHLGPDEMSADMAHRLRGQGVTIVDAFEVRKRHPVCQLHGWALKPYAMLHSRFQHVLLLDADNVPVVDPTFLFDTQPYAKYGSIFWPDYGRLSMYRSIWRVTGVPYRDEPEFESGEIVVDKQRCWNALALTMWMNEFSDFFYRHIHGDKETFHLSWRRMCQPYAMIRHPVESLSGVMCQHDFDGRRIFQHRNSHKFSLHGDNRRIEGFWYEEKCLAFLQELLR